MPKGFQKGHQVPKEWREKMSESHKKRGTKPPSRKGILLSEETKRKLSRIAKEKNFGKWMIGKKLSKETKRKISETKKGKTPKNFKEMQKLAWEQGLSKEAREKISKALKSKGKNFGSRFLEGKNHPNWKGGISFEPYPLSWIEILRISIRERDNYICQMCGIHQDELDKKLDCHHKDYDKNNLNPKNLISLCRSCHSQTNFNRDYWIDYFKNNCS